MAREREERIRRRAHEIWDSEGRPHGRDKEHWHRASQEIDGSADAQQAARGNDKPAATAGASGVSSGLQSGGAKPGSGPGAGHGSIGTGGGSTANKAPGTPKRRR